MDYEIHSEIEKFEEFLKLNYYGINHKYQIDSSIDAEELWSCSLFLAKILFHAQAISNISSEDGFNDFVNTYENNNGCVVNVQELFDSFFLRRIGGQISYSCMRNHYLAPVMKHCYQD